jgi:hypothetical protein
MSFCSVSIHMYPVCMYLPNPSVLYVLIHILCVCVSTHVLLHVWLTCMLLCMCQPVSFCYICAHLYAVVCVLIHVQLCMCQPVSFVVYVPTHILLCMTN